MPYPKLIWLFWAVLVVYIPVQRGEVGFASAAFQTSERLIVAWVENSSLFARIGQDTPKSLLTGGVIDPYIAPDGQSVAARSGESGGLPTELWIAAVDGGSARKVVSAENLNPGDGEPSYIARVAWGDNTTIYFGTLRQEGIGLQPQDDLWRVNVNTGAVEQLLLPGQAGLFRLSPDGRRLMLVSPGEYGQENGRISLFDPVSKHGRELHRFVGVATGAEYAFYPQVFWGDDGVRIAIPDPDAVYRDGDPPPTTLWWLGFDGQKLALGSIPASFFGLPRWSDDATHLLYLQRRGSATSNQFDLIVAGSNGENAVQYASGDIANLASTRWISGSIQFVYTDETPGIYWLGEPGLPPQQLPYTMYSPQFVDSENVVYASEPAGAFDLYHAHLGEDASTLIAHVNHTVPVFDARLLPE